MPILGRDLVVAAAVGSLITEDPKTEVTFVPVAKTTSKALNLSPNTVDATNDSSGPTTQTLVTRLDAEVTATSHIEKKDATSKPTVDVIVHLTTQVAAGEQPTMWINMAGEQSPIEVWAWVVITGCNITANTDDIMTAEFTFKPAAHDEDVTTWIVEEATVV